MKQLLSDLSQATLNLVFPIYCQGCCIKLTYNNKNYLCRDCIEGIRLNAPPFCIRCGRSLSGDKDIKSLCADCLNKSYYFQAAWQACEYEGLIKELIHSFKYKSKPFLKRVLAEILCNFTKRYIDYKKIDAIIPVPMYPAGMRSRGFNQAALLSRALSKALNISYLEDSLLKIRDTKQQVELKKSERLQNIKGAFSVRENGDLMQKRLLLIDDVFTTGATANECAKTLTAAGVKSVWVLTLTRGI